MSAFTRWACALVRAWTWLYTSCLPDEIRESRRLEIESDLWDSQRDSAGVPQIRVAAQVLFRLALGIPDDLRWRLETRAVLDRAPNSVRTRAVIAATAGALFVAFVWVLAVGQPPPAPPGPPDLRVFVVGSRRLPAPPPPPPPPPPSPSRTAGAR